MRRKSVEQLCSAIWGVTLNLRFFWDKNSKNGISLAQSISDANSDSSSSAASAAPTARTAPAKTRVLAETPAHHRAGAVAKSVVETSVANQAKTPLQAQSNLTTDAKRQWCKFWFFKLLLQPHLAFVFLAHDALSRSLKSTAHAAFVCLALAPCPQIDQIMQAQSSASDCARFGL